jgi:hypothetical protein
MLKYLEIVSFLFQFYFVNCFYSLFYIAFYLQDIELLRMVSKR